MHIYRVIAASLLCKLSSLVLVLGMAAPPLALAGEAVHGLRTSWASSMRIVPGLEEPLVATGPTTREEDASLDKAVTDYKKHPESLIDFADAAKPFIAFLEMHPETAWRSAIQTNLGIGYYHAGHFSRAITAWEDAWLKGRHATEPVAKALVDRAVGELARMHARVGHADALEALFADVGNRPMSGPATEMVTGAREGLWMFRNDWSEAYLCGPKALKNLLITLNADPAKIAAMDDERSGPRGYTLEQVANLAKQNGIQHRLVHRTPNQPVPVPSIVNWKVHHYAAIVSMKDGLYRVQDPTFGGGDLWITKAAIDAESTGYFLVPGSAIPTQSWRTATAEEAGQVYGMGNTAVSQAGATTPNDTTNCAGNGMCTAGVAPMLVSLNLNDTPVGYVPAKGPSAKIRLTYNQREASQPAVFSFFNVSPKWTLNVLSWVQDNPSRPGISVLRYVAGGGSIDYTTGHNYSVATGAFTPDRQGQSVLVRIPATGAVTSYELRMPDGSKQVFARTDGATTSPRRIFLTQVFDPAGNALTINYDTQLRVTSLTDATGRNTVFAYGNTNSLLVTQITDPFGRSASLAYDASGRLATITDVLGLTSSFGYDAGGLVNVLTTPYGTSRFTYGSGANNSRFLEITDALGLTERFEFLHAAPGIAARDTLVPAGLNNNIYLQYRNTFHWDKTVYPITHTDYTKARITHWLHNEASQTSPIVESIKMPLERRIWNLYPGQGSKYFEGSSGAPISIQRILDDGTTQTQAFTYNAIGKPLTMTDPLGRRTVFTYDASGVDLLSVQQQVTAGGTLATIGTFTYNSQHLPLTSTDAAGQTTRFAYNAAGQPTSVTNALNETTTYNYDGSGRLTSVVNANGVTQQSRTYDGFDRVAASTDSEAYTLAYSYDAFDRVTLVTYPDGTTTRYTYDRLDLVAEKDRLNRITSFAHDANRRLIAVTDPLGQTTRYGYYGNGALASITDPKGNVTRWDIDIQSRPTAKRYANGNVETYAYESTTSRLKTITDALGQVKNYAYARDDRTTSLTYTNSLTPTANVAFSYDPFFPRIASMVDGVGTTTFQYHPVGTAGALQLALEDGPYSNDSVAYQYDALGRPVSRTVDVATETFAYDRIGRATSHTSALGAFTRTYLGQTVQLTEQRSATGVGTQWVYEGNGNDRRLRSVVNSGQARSFGFATTPENRITGITESIGATAQRSWSYSYDSADRLTQASPSTGAASAYGYDAADNLTAINGTAASFNAANQIVALGGQPFVYDSNGNLTDDGVRTYQWDAEDRLISIGYKALPGHATSFRYDGMGRRLAIIDTSQLGPTETRYLWCGESLCQARNGADEITRRYFAEGAVIPQGNTQLYYGTDHLGSVRDLSAAQNGTKVASFDYDPYGNPVAASGRVSSDFRFAGLLAHPKSGLYLAKYRAFDPKTARWLSRDPIKEDGGTNLYSYSNANPISYVDPIGLLGREWKPWTWDSTDWGAFGQGFGQGVAAAADGMIPFVDPLASLGVYNSCDPTLKQAQEVGGIFGDLALLVGTAGLSLEAQVGKTAVLGHFPEYVKLAQQLNARVFDLGDAWKSLNTAQRWAANKAFLDEGITVGRTFILANSPRAGMSYFRAELNYLLKNGYEYGTANGYRALVPKP